MMTYVANFFHQLKFVGDRCQFEFVTNSRPLTPLIQLLTDASELL